jgi:predicted RNase H-like HicB family nuclease
MNQFTAVFEQRPSGWWIAYIEEVPGVNTQGETIEGARENLQEALQLVRETNREIARERSIGHEFVREPFVLAS